MDQAALVTPDVEGGKELLAALDKDELDVRAALWLYMPEISEWRLFVATPLVDKLGPRKIYGRIQSILRRLERPHDISLGNISVVSPESELIKLFSRVIQTHSDSIMTHKFIRITIKKTFFEAAIVYRMHTPSSKSLRKAVKPRKAVKIGVATK